MNCCRKCHKEIFFVKIHPAGQEEKSIPLDIDQVTAEKPGNYIRIDENGKGVFLNLNTGEKGYRSHFATCEFADYFRKEKIKEKQKKQKEREYLLRDMPGLMKLLSDAKSIQTLKREWENGDFMRALRNLSLEDQSNVTQWKERLKDKFGAKSLF